MSIFTNYDNLSPDYIPNNISEPEIEVINTPIRPPRIVRNAKGEFIGYCWYSGELFDFQIETDYTTEELQGKTLKLSVYDFRSNLIISNEALNNNIVTLVINKDVSEKLLSGTYRGILEVISNNKVEFEQVFSIAIL